MMTKTDLSNFTTLRIRDKEYYVEYNQSSGLMINPCSWGAKGIDKIIHDKFPDGYQITLYRNGTLAIVSAKESENSSVEETARLGRDNPIKGEFLIVHAFYSPGRPNTFAGLSMNECFNMLSIVKLHHETFENGVKVTLI